MAEIIRTPTGQPIAGYICLVGGDGVPLEGIGTPRTQIATPIGYEQLTSVQLNAGAVMLQDIPADAVMALIQAEGGDVRWRGDGVPTAAEGMLLAYGQERTIGGDLASYRFIAATGQAGAVLNVSYF
jgi:hypothetical protein